MRKRIIAIFVVMMLLGCLPACGRGEHEDNESNSITMYLWDFSMTKELTPWLEEKFPDINFEFVVGYNTMDFYSYLEERGELPDILTCRRFSLNDAAGLKERLMDLSGTELVGTFYTSYIENNRDTDNAIKWLPMCAELDGIIANQDVFDAYNVPIPTNYREFADACRIFEENGIGGFYNDYAEDYSCLEAMQGCAIPELMSLEGTSWRMQYESETVDGTTALDEQVWPVVFDKFEQFLKDTYVMPEDINRSFHDSKALFIDNRLAMFRGTVSDCAVLRMENGKNTVILPYFGETEDDNWLLTYPIFQVAVNSAVEQDDGKKKNIMRVLEAMFSEEGQRRAASGNFVLTYNKTVEIELEENLTFAEPCLEQNHMYQRLASTEFFAISRNVVQNMINGVYDADGAYQDFNRQLTTPKEVHAEESSYHIETGYAYTFTEHGSQAVSVVANTLRKQTGADVLIGYSSIITSSIYAGEYTEQQMNWLMNNRAALRQADMTGAQIKQVMDWLVNVKENGANPICHLNQIPVTSGMEYSMKDNGDGSYTLEEVTIDGNAIDENAVYRVNLLGNDNAIEPELFRGCPMPQEIREILEDTEGRAIDRFKAVLSEGGQPEAPTEYVTIR